MSSAMRRMLTAVGVVLVCVNRAQGGDWSRSQAPRTRTGFDVQDQDSSYRAVSCNFEEDNLCGWKTVKDGYNLKWETDQDGDSDDADDVNHYAHLSVDGRRRGDKGRLASDWLQPRPSAYRCQLQFRYYLERNSNCRLSLIQQTNSGEAEIRLWTTSTRSGLLAFSDPIVVDVDCAQDSYRFAFEGEKISGRRWACGFLNNEIDVDDIMLRVYRDTPLTSPTPVTTVTTDTTTDIQTTVLSQSTASQTDNYTVTEVYEDTSTGGLDPNFLLGIIVAGVVVVLIVAAVVVAVVFMRQKRNSGKSTFWPLECLKKIQKPSSSIKQRRAITSAQESGNQQTTGLREIPSRSKGDNPVSEHMYTTADDHYASVAGDTNVSDGVYQLSSYPYDLNVNAGETNNNSDCYNRLNLKGPKAFHPAVCSDDTYDHTAQLKNGPGDDDHISLINNVFYSASTGANDHTHAQQRCKPLHAMDVYAVPHVGRRPKLPDYVEGDAIYENTPDDYNHIEKGTTSNRGRFQTQNKCPGTHDDNVSIPDEAAEAYALTGTSHYEEVDEGGRHGKSVQQSNVYNTLNANDVTAEGQANQHQNHYDHFNDPAGTGAEYNSLDLRGRARDQQRCMAVDEYSHTKIMCSQPKV